MHWIIRQLTLLLALSLLGPIAVAQSPIVLGERLSLASQRLGETRSIDIYLPPSYHDTSLQPQVYPVVYLLDAGADFRYFTTLMEKLAQGIPSVPELIVVGIESRERERDFVTGSKAFWDFVADELTPQLQSQYRCSDYRILVGHSLGGLAVITALCERPELFRAYIAHDPSLWWGDNAGLRMLEVQRQHDFGGRILYLSYSGQKERNNGRQRHQQTISALQRMIAEGAFRQLETYIAHYPEENHGSVQVRGNIDLMRRLFAELFIDRREIELRPSVITERYEALSQRLHYPFTPTESYLRSTAKWLEATGKRQQAEEVRALLPAPRGRSSR